MHHSSTAPPPPLVEVLEAFVSPINARALARTAIDRAGGRGADPAALLRQLETSTLFFVRPDKRAALMEAARAALAAPPATTTRRTVTVEVEADLNQARLASRQICQDVGLQGFAAQKLVTAVSELARNIVKYAPPGEITLEHDPQARKVRVTATDRGRGIEGLEQILSGAYRSKTGMGLGLAGTKKLASEFDVSTGPLGTTVTLGITY